MLELRKGKVGELLEIIDFINMVFSMDHKPHNFKKLLPKLYGKDVHTEEQHYLAIEDGKIKAVVCVVPLIIRNKEKQLICATIGNVAVHPYSRGKGYMQKVMKIVIEDIQKQGMDFSYLSGQRQRYAYYGYEKSGILYKYRVHGANFRHCEKEIKSANISIEKVQEENKNLEKIKYFHQKQLVFAERKSEKFLDICKSWYGNLYEIHENKECIGYLCASQNNIFECILNDDLKTGIVLKRYSERMKCDELIINVAPFEASKCEYFSKICEEWEVSADGNYLFFNLKKVLDFYLNIKAEQEILEDGEMVLEVENEKPLLIQIVGNKIKVELTDQSVDYTISKAQVAKILFSLEPVFGVEKEIREKYHWFPLPLALNEVDKC